MAARSVQVSTSGVYSKANCENRIKKSISNSIFAIMLDDLELFVAIVDAGSLNAAAKRLGMPAPTLTRRLQALEAGLNCKLLNRSARRLAPTNEGRQYYERCQPLLAALRQETAALDGTLNRVEGAVRLLAPLSMANDMLLPVWTRLLREHPGLKLELKLNNSLDDLYSGMADLALRVGEQSDAALRQRKIGMVRTILVAAPDYLAAHGQPGQPADLAAISHCSSTRTSSSASSTARTRAGSARRCGHTA